MALEMSEPLPSLRADSLRPVNKTSLKILNGLVTTEHHSRAKRGRYVTESRTGAWTCAPSCSFLTAVSRPLYFLCSLQDKLLHSLAFGLWLSVPCNLFVGITNKKTDWLKNVKIQMYLYNNKEQNYSKWQQTGTIYICLWSAHVIFCKDSFKFIKEVHNPIDKWTKIS